MKRKVRKKNMNLRTLLLAVIVISMSIYGCGADPEGESKNALKDDEVDVVNSFGMTFNYIPAGVFIMGSPEDEIGRDFRYETQHEVTLTRAFYIQTTEVTQGQWQAVMGYNPSEFQECGSNCPVETVSWEDIQIFIETLNTKGEGVYRLPTEAEWEYAARAGSTTALPNGDLNDDGSVADKNMDAMGWYALNDDNVTHPVGKKRPNDWGVYDMHGNVEEWCQDGWGGTDHPSEPITDPLWDPPVDYNGGRGHARVARGGRHIDWPEYCRSASRRGWRSFLSGHTTGFRLVLEE